MALAYPTNRTMVRSPVRNDVCEVSHAISSSQYPDAPILLLSDVSSLPPDIAPYVKEFVRKGEPARLMTTLQRMLPKAEGFA